MGRNFKELCNEALELLFYTPVSTFAELDSTEGRLVKLKMNNALRTICGGEQGIWKFREREKDLYLIGEQKEYPMVDGFILFIRPDDRTNRIPLLLNQEWQYLPLTATGQPIYYWIFKNKINLFPTPTQEMEGNLHKIRFLTNNFAQDENNKDKPILELETDEPIIPEIYRSILVYAVCKDFRSSRADAKSEFYRKEYNNLYNDMLYSQQLTEDYIKGGTVGGYPMSSLSARVQAFHNPYVQGVPHNG